MKTENKPQAGERTQMTVAQLRDMQKLAMEAGNGDLFTYLGYLIQQQEAQP